jgi:hypothetical protein
MSKFEIKSLNLILVILIDILNFKNDKHYHYQYNSKSYYKIKHIKFFSIWKIFDFPGSYYIFINSRFILNIISNVIYRLHTIVMNKIWT